MAKARTGTTLITNPLHRRRVLILPRMLKEAADKQASFNRGDEYEEARKIIGKWAGMVADGRLDKKETALNANFLNDIFGAALNYVTVENAAAQDGVYNLDREFAVPGVGNADAALGLFTAGEAHKPRVLIELKSADVDLDTDRSNGRTAVQQLFDYLNALPDTSWGIVSNFTTLRLYHKDRGSQAYELFTLEKLHNDPDHFAAFWCLLEAKGLLPHKLAGQKRSARADELILRTGQRQKDVGDELYSHYSSYRSALIATLRDDYDKPLDEAIRIAQKIFDRVIFVAFCEDRGLVNAKIIERAYEQTPIFTRIKNPRWQNFVALFHGIDQGHRDLGIPFGYNGGLFKADAAIDELELPDEPWTTAFKVIGSYEFKDEVNVDVLGHIFERSITELEKLRVTGLFSKDTIMPGPKPKMQKSAERKRFGIYYTPPEFTAFIVRQTLGALLEQRFAELARTHKVTAAELSADVRQKTPQLRAYFEACFEVVRQIKVVDPACGSGAFLIAAYEYLEDTYFDVIRNLAAQSSPLAAGLAETVPDLILKENLYGVDLSEEAVEITRLALWIRTARPGKTLADLSHNVRCGNSLVSDVAVHPRGFDWRGDFPEVFARPQGGFDAVIGNPPWERVKMQEREFFAFSAPDIASAVSAATRRKLIAGLAERDRELFRLYEAAQQAAEKTSSYARTSGRYPLTGQGDINTYMLFAELARTLVAPLGRVGLLVPSGIATDNTTKEFFADMVDTQTLISLHDFENKKPYFEDVHRSFKFCTLVIGGSKVVCEQADFVFFARDIAEIEDTGRHIVLTKKDIALLNPNTKTCPIFRTRQDAEITKAVYRRVPVLIDKNRKDGGNPWAIQFVRMFDQTNDAEHFIEPVELKKQGYKLEGNVFRKGKQTYLPLYEAKMTQAYDHRAASILTAESNWVRQGQTEETSPVEHANPEYATLPRWWVDDKSVADRVGTKESFIGFKDISSATNQRTMIAAAVPFCAAQNHLIIVNTQQSSRLEMCLLANLNAFVYDYITRQKMGGVTLNFFIVEQLPTLPPDTYADKCPWDKKRTLEAWISERVLKLTCTANDMIPLAQACDFNPPGHVWKWKEAERAALRAELDAAYFHLYGMDRAEVEYILSTFQAAGEPGDERSTAGMVLAAFDELGEGEKVKREEGRGKRWGTGGNYGQDNRVTQGESA